MSRLVVAANRGPVALGTDEEGRIVARHASGGLAPSLAEALRDSDAVFVAAAMTDAERATAREGWPGAIEAPCRIRLVDVAPEVATAAYRTVANETLWFLYHGLFDLARAPVFDASFSAAFEHFRAYNAAIAEAIVEEADKGATVVVNDYHLCLVGPHLRSARPDLSTVHFSHTPFCTAEELAVLPDEIAREIVGAMASFGACGFHTERWAERFSRCASALALAEPVVFAAPLGVDADALGALAQRASVLAQRERLTDGLGHRRLVVRSDRIELSKNIVRGFLAFGELLELEPRWRGEVEFLARTYSSREDLEQYVAYRSEVEAAAREVNERFGAPGYVPVHLEIADDFDATIAALCSYDVLVVNPVRDGMNLVAKEGPAINRRDGVLVLSEEAGAFEELGAHVLGVSPFDVSATARALSSALRMGPSERAVRAAALRGLVGRLPPAAWLDKVRGAARRPHS